MRQPRLRLRLQSRAALVFDLKSGRVLYSKHADQALPIASISKLMTAVVALDAKPDLQRVLAITNADRDWDKGTGSRLRVGSHLSRRDLLHIALMASENRAAAALSRYYRGGRRRFVAAMNRKAAVLGMKHTFFVNPTGLSPDNVSSARDLEHLVAAAYHYALIRRFSTDLKYRVKPGRGILEYHNSDALMHFPGWHVGLQKTGFINEAGHCLVLRATIRRRPTIIVLLGAPNAYAHYSDAIHIRAWLLRRRLRH